MEENTEQLMAHLDMDEEFEQLVNVRTMVGNGSARAILQLHIDEYFNNKLAGLNPQLSPILLIGGKGTGVHVMARAVSNTFGNLLCHTITAKWLNDAVIYLHSFLAEGDEFSGYYIDGDKLNSNNQLQLSKTLNEKKVFFYSFESMSWEKRPFDRLIILSTSNKNEIPHMLLKQFKIQVNLSKLTVYDIELALRQRVSLLGWTISSPELLSKIAHSCSEIGSAMQVLSMAHLVVRSRNEDILTEKQLNVALHLLDKNIKAANQKLV